MLLSATPRPHAANPFLAVGKEFEGTQILEHKRVWRLSCFTATIHAVDHRYGIVDGCNTTTGVMPARSTMVMFFRGEIIDNVNYFFRSDAYGASFEHDMEFWGRFPGFAEYKSRFEDGTVDLVDLSLSQYMFMRWKEIGIVYPVTGPSVRAYGFHYVSLDKATGRVQGSQAQINQKKRVWKIDLSPQSPAEETENESNSEPESESDEE